MRFIVLFFVLVFPLNSYSQPDTFYTAKQAVPFKKLAPVIATESALYLGSMAYLRFIWYEDMQRVPFHFYNDNRGYLQIDKYGHAFGSYLESYISYEWLRSVGVKKKQALLFGGTAGLIMQTPIEIFDGLYEGWGFSTGDMIANAAGSAFVIGQELAFDSQPIKYKFSFTRSFYAELSNGWLGNNYLESLFYDYNGHTYWLSTGVHHVFPNKNIPEYFRGGMPAYHLHSKGSLPLSPKRDDVFSSYLPEHTHCNAAEARQ